MKRSSRSWPFPRLLRGELASARGILTENEQWPEPTAMMHRTRSTSAIGFLADLRHGENHDLDAAAQWRLRLEVIEWVLGRGEPGQTSQGSRLRERSPRTDSTRVGKDVAWWPKGCRRPPTQHASYPG
jgi:hypothetical protein